MVQNSIADALVSPRRIRRVRAVSSVVEHLVYTEAVGGSSPSPPNRGGYVLEPPRVFAILFLAEFEPLTAHHLQSLVAIADGTRR